MLEYSEPMDGGVQEASSSSHKAESDPPRSLEGCPADWLNVALAVCSAGPSGPVSWLFVARGVSIP